MKTKNISRLLLTGVILNSLNLNVFAGILSEDGRYETFEGNNITIDNILEEDKVDVEIEGNTMVNVANQKDPVPITKAYTVENTNHIPLQGEYDGKARPVIEGNTMYYNNDTGELSETFIEGANLSLVSSFEDQLITQEMVDSGQEKPENLGKYKVEYRVTGKNKFNSVNIQNNKYQNCNTETLNFTIVDNTDYSITGFIPVKPNTNYKISGSFESGAYYDNNKIPIKTAGAIRGMDNILTPNECYYIVLNSKWGTHDLSTLQIEEGSVATEYESYKESIKTFYLNSPLLEGDTIEDIDGKATHVKRFEKVILDGSEDWISNPNGTQAIIRLNSTVSGGASYCDKLPTTFDYIFTEGAIYEGRIGLGIIYNSSTLTSLDSVITYLQTNPITVIYELAEPIYEIISEESILCDLYVNSHLDLNTNIPVNKVDFIPTSTNLNYLYPSAEYIVQFESDNKGKIDTVSLGDKVLYNNYTVNKGINRFNVTTPSEISSTELILDGIGFNLSNLLVTEATDENFDYFEGIKSVGESGSGNHNIEIVSKNSGSLSNISIHNFDVDGNSVIHELIEPIEDGEYFKICYTNNSEKNVELGIALYYSDGVRYSPFGGIGMHSKVFINNSGSPLKRIRTYRDNNYNGLCIENLSITKVKNIEDTSIINYKDYESNKIEIPLSEPLRSLPNGIKDRIIKRNGQWVVERNCGEVVLDGSEDELYYDGTILDSSVQRFQICADMKKKGLENSNKIRSDKFKTLTSYVDVSEHLYIDKSTIVLFVDISKLSATNIRMWLSENPVTIVYQLEEPIYESLNIDPTINTYLDVTHISNNSNIHANMKVIINRTINRAVESIELAKTNPTVANISKARMWTNLLKESIKKDELNNEINIITNIEDLQLERKTASANMDVYIKSENMLLMSLSTNSITFEDYSGVDDMELNNAINISINSSLPYQLNSYLLSEIENSDKSNRIEKDLLNIKSSSDVDYKMFNDINEKLALEDDCDAGNNKSHSIDLKLKGSQAHKADVYKTVIKFEAEQK